MRVAIPSGMIPLHRSSSHLAPTIHQNSTPRSRAIARSYRLVGRLIAMLICSKPSDTRSSRSGYHRVQVPRSNVACLASADTLCRIPANLFFLAWTETDWLSGRLAPQSTAQLLVNANCSRSGRDAPSCTEPLIISCAHAINTPEDR